MGSCRCCYTKKSKYSEFRREYQCEAFIAYSDNNVIEGLVKHSIDVALEASNIAKCLNLNPNIMYIIGLLHDIGKALLTYQEMRSFPGHEVFSTIVVKILLEKGFIKIDEVNIDSNKATILYAILFHHQAHRSLIKAITEAKKISNSIRRRVDAEAMNVVHVLKCIIDLQYRKIVALGHDSKGIVTEVAQSIASVDNMRVLLGGWLTPSNQLIMARSYGGILMVADKYVAVVNRGGKHDEYFKSVEKLVHWCRGSFKTKDLGNIVDIPCKPNALPLTK